MACRALVAWQEEFWPPTAAEFVVHLVWTLCKRALWLYDPDLRQAYVSAVPKVSGICDVCHIAQTFELRTVQAARQTCRQSGQS